MMQKIKGFIKEIIVGIILFVIMANVISYMRKPDLKSDKLEPFTVILLNGEKYTPLKDKPILIHFWATWCPTCKVEAPNIESVSKEYEVLTFAVNSGDNQKIEAFMRKNGLTYRVVNDKYSVWAKEFNIKAFPTTFIYNAKKVLKFSEVGYTSTIGLLGRMKLL